MQEKLISWSIKHQRLPQFLPFECLFFLNQPFCMQFSRWCVLWEPLRMFSSDESTNEPRKENVFWLFFSTIHLNCFFTDGDFMQILGPPFIILSFEFSVQDERRWKGEVHLKLRWNFKTKKMFKVWTFSRNVMILFFQFYDQNSFFGKS